MSALHTAVFKAIHELPLPVTPEKALEAGMGQIPIEKGTERNQFEDWFASNGAKLCQLLNGQVQ